MERLTAFEFIGATDGPQIVRIRRREDGIPDGAILAQFVFTGWVGADLVAVEDLQFDSRDDLIIEGEGLGHPYWNDDPPTWLLGFDSYAETRRLSAIREAVRREINRALIHHGALQ